MLRILFLLLLAYFGQHVPKPQRPRIELFIDMSDK
jgi:hypothetical protein